MAVWRVGYTVDCCIFCIPVSIPILIIEMLLIGDKVKVAGHNIYAEPRGRHFARGRSASAIYLRRVAGCKTRVIATAAARKAISVFVKRHRV